MCGRAYATYSEEELLLRYLTERSKRNPLGLRPTYNFAPSQRLPLVCIQEGERALVQMRWGLIPSWAKQARTSYAMINARAESVASKPAYRAAYRARRAILPLSGFYEWRRQPLPKQPFAFAAPDGTILSVAALWESWQPSEAEPPLQTFTLLTTAANALMAPIHDRMPVLLTSTAAEESWLDPKTPANDLPELLQPAPAGTLHTWAISTRVNSPAHNDAELLNPTATQSN